MGQHFLQIVLVGLGLMHLKTTEGTCLDCREKVFYKKYSRMAKLGFWLADQFQLDTARYQISLKTRKNKNDKNWENIIKRKPSFKHRKNCECASVSQLIVRYKDCHESRFSIVSIVISVSNVTSPLDCSFRVFSNGGTKVDFFKIENKLGKV